MTSSVPTLLRRLEDRWREAGAPITSHLRPGLTPEDLDRAELELGFPFPTEVREWYSWHNGVTQKDSGPSTSLPNLMFLCGMGTAMEERHRLMAMKPITEDMQEEFIFKATWLPIAYSDTGVRSRRRAVGRALRVDTYGVARQPSHPMSSAGRNS